MSGSNALLAAVPRQNYLMAADPVSELWASLPEYGGGNSVRAPALTNPGVNVRPVEYIAGQPVRPGYRNELIQLANLASGFAGTSINAVPVPGIRNLPMDAASRAARAAEQGYTVNAYKAMYPEYGFERRMVNGRWTEFGDRKPITAFNNPDAPYAGFFSGDPEVANRFAQAFGRPSAIYPARLKFENPVIIDARGRPAAAFQFDAIAKQHGTLDDMARFRGAFAEGSGHDGVILRNTADEGTVYVPRTPQQARSRFANFDPAQMNNPDMLASWAPIVSLLAGGAFAGQAGPQ